jgi:hypothetical protein
MKSTFHFIHGGYRLVLLFSFLILLNGLEAQEHLPPTKFSIFTHSNGISSEQADEVSKKVEGYVQNAKRFKLLTTYSDAIDAELDRQKESIYLDGYMVEQNRAIGARYLVVGHLISVSDGIDYATVQLGVIDVETGEIVAVETLSPSGRSAVTITNIQDEVISSQVKEPAAAAVMQSVFREALKTSLQKNVMDFLDEHFPMEFLMTRMEESGGKIVNVELYGYKSHKFNKNQTFLVIQKIRRELPGTNEVATEQNVIATLVVKVLKGDFAECAVSKQDQERLYEYKEAGGVTVIKKK